jgi:hypothetical protein
MSTPTPPTRENLPSRIAAASAACTGRTPSSASWPCSSSRCRATPSGGRCPRPWLISERGLRGGGDGVGVQCGGGPEGRQYFDVLFGKPVGQGKVGEVLDPAPAKIYPVLGASWKWQTTNALRFQASGGLPVASEYRVTLDPAKIVSGPKSSRAIRS